jgi:hypothetical protein
MSLPPPAAFNDQLSSDRLEMVSRWLLEELYATEDDLSRPTDNGYTRGCTTFGRQRNRIIAEASSGALAWLGLTNGSNDIVFTIGGVPCRFSNDDAANPSKDAVTTANRHQMEFLEFADQGEPGRFCFVIDRGQDESGEPRVEFLGFTPGGKVACRWVSDSVRVLRLEGHLPLAPTVQVDKPQVAPKRREQGHDEGSLAAEAGR